MRTSQITLLFTIFLVVSCTNKKEIQELKSRIAMLEEENKRLKETDQSYYSSVIDFINAGNYEDALNKLNELIYKFPKSSLIKDARKQRIFCTEQIANKKIVSDGITKLNEALSMHDFNNAKDILIKIKPKITESRYENLNKKIYEEENKPLSVTLRELKADPYKYLNKRIKIGPLAVTGNTVSKKRFYVCALVKSKRPNRSKYNGYDSDYEACIGLFYSNTKNKHYWRDLDTQNSSPIINAIGFIDIDWTNDVIFYANEIQLLSK